MPVNMPIVTSTLRPVGAPDVVLNEPVLPLNAWEWNDTTTIQWNDLTNVELN